MSDYVRGLRERIGNDLLLMPSTHVLIRDDAGRVLLVRHVEGRWQLPGGAIEPGERPSEAARRECLEEAGVEVELGEILGVYGGPDHQITYENGDRAAWVATLFAGRIAAGEPAPSDDETAEVGWFAPDEIAALPQTEATRRTIRDLLDGVSYH